MRMWSERCEDIKSLTLSMKMNVPNLNDPSRRVIMRLLCCEVCSSHIVIVAVVVIVVA